VCFSLSVWLSISQIVCVSLCMYMSLGIYENDRVYFRKDALKNTLLRYD